MKRKFELIVSLITLIMLSTGFDLISSTSPSDGDKKSLNVLSEETYGGADSEYAYAVTNTSDGGSIIAAHTLSFGEGAEDAYIIKVDAEGDLQWNQTVGGPNLDTIFSIIETPDGGYATAGLTESYGNGNWDAWLVKLDSTGQILWNKTFGREIKEYVGSLAITQDGGFIVAGYNESGGVGEKDIFLIKTDSSGNLEWNKTYGSNYSEYASSVIPTDDGGYLVAGVIETALCWGCQDIILLKTDGLGNQLWTKIIGGSSVDIPSAIIPSNEGGYLIAGRTESYGAGLTDVWLVKIDSSGSVEWNCTYGGPGHDYASGIIQTSDNGYVLAGRIDVLGEGEDGWFLKVNSTGHLQYNQTLGGSNNDALYGITEIANNKFVLAGRTNSFGAGDNDVWVLYVEYGNQSQGIPGYSIGITLIILPFITIIWFRRRIAGKKR